MGAQSPKKVDFERLADALNGYHSAYLVVEVGLIGGRTRRNVENRNAVTLL